MITDLSNNESLKVKSQLRYITVFWIGYLMYFLGDLLGVSQLLDVRICQAVQSLGLISIIIAFIILIGKNVHNKYLAIVFSIYFIWQLYIVSRGFEFNYTFAKKFLFEQGSGGLIYLIPLIVFFPQNLTFLRKLFDFLIVFGIVYLFLGIVFIKQLVSPGEDSISQALVEDLTTITIPVIFILLTFIYHSNKRIFFAIVITSISLLFSIIRARRGVVFISSSLLFFSIIIYLIYSKQKILAIYGIALSALILGLFGSNLYKIKDNEVLGFIANRGTEDTRTGVELYFYDDLKTKDWVIGKGISGQYFCPDIEEDQPTDYRSIIETGYLQLILKGGIINLSLLLLICIPAIIKGFFYSNNLLSKACSIWLLQFIINLYPQNAVSFNLSYLFVWICVGILYSRHITELSNETIINKLYVA